MLRAYTPNKKLDYHWTNGRWVTRPIARPKESDEVLVRFSKGASVTVDVYQRASLERAKLELGAALSRSNWPARYDGINDFNQWRHIMNLAGFLLRDDEAARMYSGRQHTVF